MSIIEQEEEQDVQKTPTQQVILRPNTNPFLYKIHKDQKTIAEIYQVMRNWKPGSGSEVWVYQYGTIALAVGSFLSSSYINWYFRETLYLLNYSRISSYLVMFLAPGISAGALHFYYVTSNILQDKRMCSTCLQVRGMAIQGFCSIGYPVILVPLICYPVAKRLKNYSVPNITMKNKFPVIQFTREMLRPIRGNLWAITAAQAILGMGLTYYEQHNYILYLKPGLDKVKSLFSPHYSHPPGSSADVTNKGGYDLP